MNSNQSPDFKDSFYIICTCPLGFACVFDLKYLHQGNNTVSESYGWHWYKYEISSWMLFVKTKFWS